MESLGLLVGHLVGDYILQNDWMASNKTNKHPGKKPDGVIYRIDDGIDFAGPDAALLYRSWLDKRDSWWRGHIACTVHCLLYTFSVWLFTCWWMPWWGLVVCFVAHWPVDRFRLAGWWMRNVSGQRSFADGPMSPWSIIIVDNVYHILTLFVIGVLATKI